MRLLRGAVAVFTVAVAPLSASLVARAAESTTGVISGTVTSAEGKTIAGARVDAASPSGTYSAVTDARGHYIIVGVVPDTYTIATQVQGFEEVTARGITVIAGQTETTSFKLVAALKTIGQTTAHGRAFTIGSTSDAFNVSGAAAQARSPIATSSGLGSYIAGTVQGAIAGVPGVDFDSFANAILRGGKVEDAVFDYDSVAIPQGLVAEPGGNIVSAQLATTGIASTNVVLAGYTNQLQNALGGIVDQIPAIGTYPGSSTLDLGIGSIARYNLASFQILGATPDLKWRYAFAGTIASQDFLYGDDSSFYPAEAATYGVALQNRAEYSFTSNLHYRPGPSDDLSILGLAGEASYDQYGSPYAGQTVGAFDGATTTFPGETNPNAPVTYASGVRGTYDLIKAQWLHSGAHSLNRVQLYQSQYGSSAGGPFWDENGFPDGAISLQAQQSSRETGLTYDGDDFLGARHHLQYGATYRTNTSALDQVVPTADEFITSRPTLISGLAYLGDTWDASNRLRFTAFGRFTTTHVIPSDGATYDVGALDPHGSVSYRLGSDYSLRATFDHTTVAPKPLEADRTDSTNVDANGNPAPFAPLDAESGNDFTYSFEGGGKTQFRATYFERYDKNRIDVLPFNFRSAAASGTEPNGLGVPTNVGDLRAHGAELYLHRGGFGFDADYVRAQSSSASQFAYNGLNAAAIEANHLFPASYIPALSATLSYEARLLDGRIRVTPSLSFESGYPYGNGKKIFTFDAAGKPVEVNNDNFVNPGYNYYFLRDPSLPFNAASNPYIGNLGTPEGNDPNTLTSPPQTMLALHIEGDLVPRLTAILDVTNLLGNFSPTQYQGNPWLVGPPGYKGGNALYSAALAGATGYPSYALGNGVPTNDGVTQSVPWTYGTGGYVPEGYPLGRTIQVRLRYTL